MTAKKREAQKGKRGKATREQLKARAAGIIEDVRGFDADTRRAVYVALANLKFAESNPQPATKYTDPVECARELDGIMDDAERGFPTFDEELHQPDKAGAGAEPARVGLRA